MDNLLSEGLTLMVFGMGFVFTFLTLLVVVTTYMSKLVVKFEPAAQPKVTSSRSTPAVAVQQGSDELVAVISAAVHKYRS